MYYTIRASIISSLIVFLATISSCRAGGEVEYSKPKITDLFTNVPHTTVDAWNMSFNTKPETLWTWGAVISSTVLFYIYDEEIFLEFQRLGRRIGLGNDDNTRSMIKIKETSIFRGPTDLGSALYFMGDGWTQFTIGASFFLSGAIRQNNRAWQTGSQIFHGLFTATIANQILKRSFGRETPTRRSSPRGTCRPFRSFSTYNNDVSKYDAMPTGHLMATTIVFTVIDTNYPEYRYWFRPLGLVWATLLGFQMVNNGVHWISDYPLGMAMGYVFGKVVTQYGRKEKTNDKKISDLTRWELYPIFASQNNDRSYGLLAMINF